MHNTDHIYEIVSSKELKAWCKMKHKVDGHFITVYWDVNQHSIVIVGDICWYKELPKTEIESDFEVVSNPIMIGDMLNWWKAKWVKLNNWYTMKITDSIECDIIFGVWGDFLKPLEAQSDYCIECIDDLIGE